MTRKVLKSVFVLALGLDPRLDPRSSHLIPDS